jgi:hypothetical protein
LGRLAALPLGGTLVTPKGETLVVSDRAALRPFEYRLTKDIHDTLFESLQRDRIRVKSLRDFVRTFGENRPKLAVEEGAEPPLVPAEELDVVVDEGELRAAALSHSLKQPYLLDLYQDEVFRRPFQAKQIIFGAPGSGKTTTLIRRLDFLISSEALEADSIGLLDKLTLQSEHAHPISWYFLVPTDTLRRYVKDSFTDLVIPGFEKNTLTWDELRMDLASNFFRILTPAASGGLRLAPSTGRVSKAALADTVSWYSDFSAFQAKAYFQAQKAYAEFLAQFPDRDIAHLGDQLKDLLEKSSVHSLLWFKRALLPFQEEVASQIEGKHEGLRRELKSAFQSHVERDPALIDGLVSLLWSGEKIKKTENPEQSSKIFKREAFGIYSSALLEQAKALAKGQGLSRDSRSGRVLAWLGEGRLLPQERLKELGAEQLVCRALRRFKVDTQAFYNAYFETIIPNYLRFRRQNRLWYANSGGASRQVEPFEVDLLLLAFLEPGAEILKNSENPTEKSALNWSLDNQAYLTRNQVLVDGACDFSPVQLKCAVSLANSNLSSVTVAADLGARSPIYGLKSLDDFEWALPKATLTELQINYRQSSQLLELSDLLSGSSHQRFLTSRFESKGPKPVMAQNLLSLNDTASWLADRLAEVAQRSGRLPSTAVAVLKSSDIGPLSEALTKALEKNPETQAIKALACRPGQPLGLFEQVRVLTLDEARGLEFEAFFAVFPEANSKSLEKNSEKSLDKPAGLEPTLADRVYLASTRAVTYLGFAFRSALPAELDNLSSLTVPSWSQPQETFTAVSL